MDPLCAKVGDRDCALCTPYRIVPPFWYSENPRGYDQVGRLHSVLVACLEVPPDPTFFLSLRVPSSYVRWARSQAPEMPCNLLELKAKVYMPCRPAFFLVCLPS